MDRLRIASPVKIHRIATGLTYAASSLTSASGSPQAWSPGRDRIKQPFLQAFPHLNLIQVFYEASLVLEALLLLLSYPVDTIIAPRHFTDIYSLLYSNEIVNIQKFFAYSQGFVIK